MCLETNNLQRIHLLLLCMRYRYQAITFTPVKQKKNTNVLIICVNSRYYVAGSVFQMLEKDCWLCPERFETTKMLKNHLSGSTHHQMEVICPWGPDKPIRYRRVTELMEHAGRVHREILKEPYTRSKEVTMGVHGIPEFPV